MKGYYKLTAEVKNPRPDRRRKRSMDCVASWPAGTVVWIHDTREADFKRLQEVAGERLPGSAADLKPRGHIRFADHSQIMFDLSDSTDHHKRYPETVQGNDILAACEPAPKTLGQILKQADWVPEELLALLIDAGKVTLEDVDAVKHHDLSPELDGNDLKRDAVSKAFWKRHGI